MSSAHRDDRIPLRIGALADAGADDALLIEGDAQPPPGRVSAHFSATAGRHMPGCVCCSARPGAATALGALFQARARGEVAWFAAVVAVVRDPAAFAADMLSDRLAAARFRLVH